MMTSVDPTRSSTTRCCKRRENNGEIDDGADRGPVHLPEPEPPVRDLSACIPCVRDVRQRGMRHDWRNLHLRHRAMAIRPFP
jgi:hypothetical protein